VTRLLFARHGNTFGPTDPVVWVGSGSDLPLVEKGLAQAHRAAEYLAANDLRPSAVFAATLKRTTQFATIVCKDLGLPLPKLDARLNEIHYGSWEGASTEQIAADPDRAQALDAWQKGDVWPDALEWQTTQQQVLDNLAGVLDEVRKTGGESPLIVSSNGILRFAPRLLNTAGSGSYQLKTGALGCIDQTETGWAVRFWGA
jgi:probable phosphoglycerate mutase